MAAKRELNVQALSRKDLATLLNSTQLGRVTTPQTISNWDAAGCPLNPDGTYSLPAVAAWLALDRKNKSDRASIPVADGKTREELEIEKLRAEIENIKSSKEYRDVKTELEGFRAKLQSGEIIPKSDVDEGFRARARFIRETLDALPAYAPHLLAKNIVELRQELESISIELCNRLSK